MIGDRKKQKAGDNSQQLQANTINITNINGIDEKRAREIFSEMYEVARKNFTSDAYQVANQRVSKFEESLMPKIIQIDGALEKFADPSFQFLLTEAHKTAASTEREVDYDLLSELLIHRIKKGELRKTRAGIEKAVEIVDQVDDDALCALTVTYAITKIFPNMGKIIDGLDILQSIFEKLIYLDLPDGQEWLEHLEILSVIRLNTLGNLKKIEDYYSEYLDGYICNGIEKCSESYEKALKILSDLELPQFLLLEHELLNDYVRLPIVAPGVIETNRLTAEYKIGELTIKQEITLSDVQKQGLKNILELYDKSEEKKQLVRKNFMNEWKKRSALNILLSWWDNIPISFNLTAVGRVLGHANAQRYCSDIPSID